MAKKKPLKCEGQVDNFETDKEFGEGSDLDFHKAVEKATADAMAKVDARLDTAFQTIKCPEKCETWLRLRTKLKGPPFGKVMDPRTRMITVRAEVEWHIDVLCKLPSELF